MDLLQTASLGALLPAALAVAVVLGGRPWLARPLTPIIVAAAIAMAWVGSFVGLFGVPPLPPVDATDWAFWLGALAVLPALPGVAARASIRVTLVALLGAAAGWTLVAPLAAHSLGAGEAVAWTLAVAATVVYLERVFAAASSAADPRGATAGLALLAAGVASALVLSGTASLAQRVGGLAAGLGGLAALGLKWPEAARVRGAAPVLAVVLGAAVWAGYLYAELSPVVLALLLVAPLALLAARPVAARFTRPLVAMALPALFTVVPLGAANGVAASLYFDDSADAAYGPDASGGEDAGAEDSDYDYGY